MRTWVIWDNVDSQIKMFWLDGDYSHLNRVYINSGESSGICQDQLLKLVYDDQVTKRSRCLMRCRVVKNWLALRPLLSLDFYLSR